MVVKESGDPRIRDEDNVATVTTVATVWPTQWLKFLSAHGNTAFSA